MCHRSHAIGEKADARSYGVANAAEDLEALGLGPARGGRIRQLPAELQAATWRYGATRVAHRYDDIPALADLIDGFALLVRDVNAELAHDRDGERMDPRRLRPCALDLEPVSGEGAQESLGHLRAGRVVGAKEEDALHASSMTRGAGGHPAPRSREPLMRERRC